MAAMQGGWGKAVLRPSPGELVRVGFLDFLSPAVLLTSPLQPQVPLGQMEFFVFLTAPLSPYSLP